MQNALQNPHYKKIWKKVIMNNNPQAKSLEEALEMEGKEDECYILQYENSNPQMHAVLEEMRGDYPFYEKFQILGRPITLEDVLLLIQKNSNRRNEIGIILLENGNLYIKPKSGGEFDFEWHIKKYCEEQTPETWEAISNLI